MLELSITAGDRGKRRERANQLVVVRVKRDNLVPRVARVDQLKDADDIAGRLLERNGKD